MSKYFSLLVLFSSSAGAIIATVNPSFDPPVQRLDAGHMGFYFLIQVIFFYGAGALLGYWKEKKNIHVSITRKLFCMLFFCLSFLVPRIVSRGDINEGVFIAAMTIVTIILILSLARPFRSRFKIPALVFQAVSREGEHTQTLKWLTTEAMATSLIIYLFHPFLSRISGPYSYFLLLPAFASGFADAAAEIVGTRWGKRKYRTPGFFVQKNFYRTLEGSLAFFTVTATIALVMAFLPGFQLTRPAMMCLIALPFTLTMAEAVSPHTWDNPFIYAIGYLTVYTIYGFSY